MTAAIDELAANVGRAQMAVGDTQGAIATFQARLASANGSGYTVLSAVMTSGIGEAHLLEHHPAQAVAWLQRARAILAGVDATARLSVAIDIQRSLGRALRDDHRLDEALATFRETLALLDRMREDSLLTESTTASVIASRRDLFTETADLLMDMLKIV